MLVQMIIAEIRAELIKAKQKPDTKYLNSLKELKRKDLYALLNSYKQENKLMVD
jgi:hypothetical protein